MTGRREGCQSEYRDNKRDNYESEENGGGDNSASTDQTLEVGGDGGMVVEGVEGRRAVFVDPQTHDSKDVRKRREKRV